MRLDRKIARGAIVFFVLYIIAALPCVVLWAMVVILKVVFKDMAIAIG